MRLKYKKRPAATGPICEVDIYNFDKNYYIVLRPKSKEKSALFGSFVP